MFLKSSEIFIDILVIMVSNVHTNLLKGIKNEKLP